MNALSPTCRAVAQQNEHWQQLIAQGHFEEEKALAALACTSRAVDAIHPTSLAQARNCGLPALSTVGKYRGKDVQQVMLQYILSEVNVAFGDKKALEPKALQMLARWAAANCYHWNLAEIKHAIYMGIEGAFAQYSEEELPDELRGEVKVYGALDVPTVIKWLQCYESLKAQQAAQARQEEHAERMRNEQQFTEEGRKLMQGLLEKLKEADRIYKNAKQLSKEAQGDTAQDTGDTGQQPEDYKARLEYRTIEDYCRAVGEDVDEYMAALEQQWKAEYQFEVEKSGTGIGKDLPFEVYKQSKYQRHLVHLNNSRAVA